MRREDKRKLIINRRIIVNHLSDLESVLDYLIEKEIFTPAIRERINNESRAASDRIRHTLDCLITRNALAYQYFLEALVLTQNTQIADILEPDYTLSERYKQVIERERARGFINQHNEASLPYPVTCTQNEQADYANGPVLTPISIQRIFRQGANFNLNPHHQHLGYQSSQSTSRSTSSSGGCQSKSMSPVMGRCRSSSVAAVLNSNLRSTLSGITNSASSNGLLSSLSHVYGESGSREASPCRVQTPVSVYDEFGEQVSPSSFTPTYDIDWADVNNLELDFVVFRTPPNIRKQISPNEVILVLLGVA